MLLIPKVSILSEQTKVYIPLERTFHDLHNRIKINLITLYIEKRRRDNTYVDRHFLQR